MYDGEKQHILKQVFKLRSFETQLFILNGIITDKLIDQ